MSFVKKQQRSDKMGKEEFTAEEKQQFIEYMLNNKALEKKLKRWDKSPNNPDYFIEMIEAMAKRDQEQGGLIISVKSDEIPTGAENIEFFILDKYKRMNMNYAEAPSGKKYIMVFTSRKEFKECNDTSGIVMFIGDVINLALITKQTDGIVINAGKHGIAFDRVILRAIKECIELKINL